MPSPENKRVAKNAVALTLRMVLATLVGLYTSRIVLGALGVVDYGIYGVVGGVVGMASFLNAAMAGATSRFITFEMGRGNQQKLKSIFSTALCIHIGIAIVVFVLAETVGLWFVNNKMNFPAERMFAVNVLYQFTILSMFVNFTQVPYAADIIAHEKMNIYAYFEIVQVTLKLIVVWLLLYTPYDRLIVYAVLMLLVSITCAMFYRWYCIRHFQEARFSTKFNKDEAKEMLKFSSYELYGNMSVVAKNQGTPIVLNWFFGVVANAAATLSLMVSGAIEGLTTTITTAFYPQIVKQYACGHITGMLTIMRHAVQFTLLAYSMIAIPCIIEAQTLLYLWLGQVPQYSIIFLQLILVAAIPPTIARTNNAAIRATGRIRSMSLSNGTFYLGIPLVSYLLLKFGNYDASTIYLVEIIMLSICAFVGFFIAKKEVKLPNFRTYTFATFRSLFVFILAFSLCLILRKHVLINSSDNIHFLSGVLQFGGRFMIYNIVIVTLSLIVALNKSERAILFRMIKGIKYSVIRNQI